MPPAEKVKEQKLKKKPGRRPTSCAECRRLKLKCDRQVPCEKCVNRGCAKICPDGCLEPSRGNRMVLSGTQELHDRIDDLCARIRELEDALRDLQGQHSDEPHPLLRTDVLRPRSQLSTEASIKHLSREGAELSSDESPLPSPELEPEPRLVFHPVANLDDTDSFGTLKVHDNGASKYMGKTARSELLMDIPGSSLDFRELYQDRNSSQDHVLSRLPVMSQATLLCDIYLKNVNALYAPLSRTELLDDNLQAIYRMGHSSRSCQMYHSAALLFATFALACHFDDQRPETGYEYYQLARMALNLAPPSRYTTLLSIQTMVNLAQYLDLSGWDNGLDSAWLDIGQAVRLGFSIGLHLNPTRWRLPCNDVEKRKHIFWQLFVADTWSSFYLGRPPSICSSYVDTPLPSLDSTQASLGVSQAFPFQIWFYGYTKMLNSVMANGMASIPPSYLDVLDLDRRVREHTVPSVWKLDPNPSPVSQDVHFYRWFVLASKEIALMNLHRPYFAQALCEQVGDKGLHDHRYIASIVAIYRSSWRIVTALDLTWALAPDTIRRTNMPWSQGLSAMIVLTLLITRAPTSHLVAPALKVLHGLQALFLTASHTCRSAHLLLPSIQRLYNKAYESVNPPQYQPSASPSEASITLEELDRLSGKTDLVTESTPMQLPTSNESTRSSSSRSSRAGNPPPSPVLGIKLESIHPVLAQDLKDYSRGQEPSLQTYTDGSRMTSPTPSLTTTASSGRGSSHSSSSYLHGPPPAQSSRMARYGEGSYPPPLSYRDAHGPSQSAPPPAFNQPQLLHSNQGQYAQRQPYTEQANPAAKFDAGPTPSYPDRKYSSLSSPNLPGFDPTIEMLDASWQTLVEQLGY